MFNLLISNVKERLAGNKAKANARLGFVGAPEGTGKIVWIVAGDSYANFIMAVSLLAAIREKRQDIRLVLTYETEYQDLIVQYMSGIKKMGFGYHCADNSLAAKQMIKRLSPFAVIFVGDEPKVSFIKALTLFPKIHKVAFQYLSSASSSSSLGKSNYSSGNAQKIHFYEACYPASFLAGSPNQVTPIESNCDYVSRPFNVLTRLVQQQVDKQLGGMLCNALDGKLFHLHNPSIQNVEDILALFLSSKGKKDEISLEKHLLVLSFLTEQNIENEKDYFLLQKTIEKSGFKWVMLSQWDQNPVNANTIVIADEQKWYAAVCASSTATHLFSSDVLHWWQSLASGAVVSVDSQFNHATNHATMAKGFESVVLTLTQSRDIYNQWNTLLKVPLEQRKLSDATRKLFWAERREAESQVNELLQRVYDW